MFSTEQFRKLIDQVNTKIENKDHQVNVDELINNEIGGVLDFGIWSETVQMQTEFNNKVAPGWMHDIQNVKYDFWMAILDETTEVLNSKHWKWWKDSTKHGDVDWTNVRVELVDLFHFILSLTIQQKNEQLLFASFINFEINEVTKKDRLIRDENYFKEFWDLFLMAVQIKSLPLVAVKWVEFWYRAGYNAEDLFKDYRIKNMLNKLRQKYGYGAKNNYKKMWPGIQENKLVEDNVIAWEIAKDMPLTKEFNAEFFDKLEEYYLKYVAI